MKNLAFVILNIFAVFFQYTGYAQEVDATAKDTTTVKYFMVVKNDGTEYVGKLLKSDAREVLLETAELGQLYIPKHEIKQLVEIKQKDISKSGTYTAETYSTRYFITTNGLPIERGDHYVLVNWYGPEAQFALNNNLSLGVMTSWIGIPIVGSIKKSFMLGEKKSMAIGVLAGTASWASPENAGVLGYASFTLGDRKANITFSAGGLIAGEINTSNYKTALFSIAAMAKINDKITFVGDSFIIVGESSGAFIIPGLRFSRGHNKAFQFGLAGIVAEGKLVPAPIPMLGWFMKL